jgi:intracellular sulfur oxidation DsrE/DsrF family protein
MRNQFLILALALSGACAAQTGKAPYRVVIDVTSSDTVVHQMVARWLAGITTTTPDAQVEVVFFGGSLDMVTQGRSVVSKDLAAYANDDRVHLVACEGTLKRKQVSKDQLLQGVGTVPDGLYQLVQRQYEGWAYIKAAR